MSAINKKTRTLLKEDLKSDYDPKAHAVTFSVDMDNQAQVELGPWIQCHLDQNLANLFSLPALKIKHTMRGLQEVDTLSNHSRQLHVLSDVIQPTAYGEHQRPILCDFLHKASNDAINEITFDPISYHAIAKNNMDMVHIQVTDDNYNPLSIKDSKTIVTLYFRRVEWKRRQCTNKD